MGQTTALARPYYSITAEGVARVEGLRGLFKRNGAIGVYGSAQLDPCPLAGGPGGCVGCTAGLLPAHQPVGG